MNFVVILWAIAVIIVIFLAFRKRKCPTCRNKSRHTGVSGSKYAQYYCKKCDKYFHLKHYSNKI